MSESYTYFISDGEHIKIGVARHPDKRIKTLSTGSSKKLMLIGFVSGGFKLEKELHSRFRKVLENHEWFHSDPELIDYINMTIQNRFVMVKEKRVLVFTKTPL